MISYDTGKKKLHIFICVSYIFGTFAKKYHVRLFAIFVSASGRKVALGQQEWFLSLMFGSNFVQIFKMFYPPNLEIQNSVVFSPPICKNMRLSQIGSKFPPGIGSGWKFRKKIFELPPPSLMTCSTIFDTSVSFSTHLTTLFLVSRGALEIQWHTWQDVSWWSHGSFLAD